MPVPASINDLSTTAASNSPAGSETPAEGDNHIRALASFIALLRDMLNGTSGNVSINGTLSALAASFTDLTTTGNTILGNAATDTLNVGAGGIIKDASGNVGIGATPSGHKLDFGTGGGNIGGVTNIGGISDAGAYTVYAGRTALNGAYLQIFGGSHATNPNQLFLGTNGSNRLAILADGRVYGTALHNNGGSVTGTATQYIASGTYTPTGTNNSNATGITPGTHTWLRVGNVVHVAGSTVAGATASATATSYFLTLPIASNVAALGDVTGGGAHQGTSTPSSAVMIVGDAAGDRVLINFISATTSSVPSYYSFQYEVK